MTDHAHPARRHVPTAPGEGPAARGLRTAVRRRPLPSVLALALLASPAAAQPSPSPAPPSAEDIAAAYAASVRFERERALARAERALAALDPEGLDERLAADPPPPAPEPPAFAVTLHGCAPAAPGEVGHVCHYSYVVDDPAQGVSHAGPDLVVGHVFPGPDGLLVRELPPPPGPYGPAGPSGALPVEPPTPAPPAE